MASIIITLIGQLLEHSVPIRMTKAFTYLELSIYKVNTGKGAGFALHPHAILYYPDRKCLQLGVFLCVCISNMPSKTFFSVKTIIKNSLKD